MSTGFECDFIEEAEGVWWYVLQNWDCPVGAWDWREFATAYGPFKTEDETADHLRANHANPGGRNMSSYQHGWKPDEVFERLKAEAVERGLVDRRTPAYRPYRW